MQRRLIFFILLALAALPPAGLLRADDDPFAAPRAAMVAVIGEIATQAGPVGEVSGISRPVLDVMGRVPRHLFVPEDIRRHAYADRPLPIGYGQTISQPYIVALMTDLLNLQAGDNVLEIGTGSAYQAAVLAELVSDVATIEIVPGLAAQAADRLRALNYDNVAAREGDGYFGWPEKAPFDAIIVTAAASHVPPPLVQQLKPGGRMIIPVGTWFMVQHLILVEKDADGTVTARQLLPVRFVPLTGGH